MGIKVKSRASAGLSGFFAPHIDVDMRKTGAVGGGLGIADAILADIEVELNYGDEVSVVNKVNGVKVDNCLAKYVVEKLFKLAGVRSGKVFIEQKILVPIGGGYGTSGGSAVAIAFGIAKALNIVEDFNTVAEAAHEADIVCRSGLGTVVGIVKPCEGIVLVSKPGGPGVAEVKCIPMDSNLVALTAFYRPLPKGEILANPRDLEKVKVLGLETLKRIELNPTPENFMENCKRFALMTGIATEKVKRVIELLQGIEGILGVSMNMIGEAIFAIVNEGSVDKVLEVVKKTNPAWVNVWRPLVKTVKVEKVEEGV